MKKLVKLMKKIYQEQLKQKSKNSITFTSKLEKRNNIAHKMVLKKDSIARKIVREAKREQEFEEIEQSQKNSLSK